MMNHVAEQSVPHMLHVLIVGNLYEKVCQYIFEGFYYTHDIIIYAHVKPEMWLGVKYWARGVCVSSSGKHIREKHQHQQKCDV